MYPPFIFKINHIVIRMYKNCWGVFLYSHFVTFLYKSNNYQSLTSIRESLTSIRESLTSIREPQFFPRLFSNLPLKKNLIHSNHSIRGNAPLIEGRSHILYLAYREKPSLFRILSYRHKTGVVNYGNTL